MSKKTLIAAAVGSAFVASMAAAPIAMAAENPFALSGLANGYQVAQAAAADAPKTKDGKCGEGKCGGTKAKPADAKAMEGKCGGDKAKTADGKVMEGKCGGTKK